MISAQHDNAIPQLVLLGKQGPKAVSTRIPECLEVIVRALIE
jgi:hypothetical protein